MLAAGLFGAVVGDLDLVPSMPAHAYLLAYGVTSQSIGYLLIQVSLPRLPAVLTSAILLAQPVMTVVLAIILLGEAPVAGQITRRAPRGARPRAGHRARSPACATTSRAGWRRAGRRA